MANCDDPEQICRLGILVRKYFITESDNEFYFIDRPGEEDVLVEVYRVLADVDKVTREVLLLFLRMRVVLLFVARLFLLLRLALHRHLLHFSAQFLHG